MTSRVFAENILQGKVAFVTGGGTGITGGIARAFAEQGAKLAIISRKEENLIAKKQFIEENGGGPGVRLKKAKRETRKK